ncbi:hypothetical protein IU450_38690 [Nocardia abscessus]|uniref:hypothetical protein n=1 Tax=Nocardia abscessus TaxID=120957 RepID=UPI0018944E99|nr:hypothetical protein [Nocardia abscessus]MBF6341765.1 hypothetical protein [Nocardia abscessus]
MWLDPVSQYSMFSNASGRLSDSQREVGEARDWLNSVLDTTAPRLPGGDDAHRTALSLLATAEQYLAEAKAQLDDAIGRYKATKE